MSAADRFWEALERHRSTSLGELTPSLLADCAGWALGMDGAGITLMQPLVRLPLGASNDQVRLAEQFQATLDEGPCLTSARRRTAVVADADRIAAEWPVYGQALRNNTDFASVVAVPLWNRRDDPFAALNLYSRSPRVPADLLDPERIEVELGDPIAAILLGALEDRSEPPRWADADSIADRLRVWTAIGMLMEAGQFDDRDAIDVLRSYAFAHNQTLDLVAGRLVRRELTAAQIIADP